MKDISSLLQAIAAVVSALWIGPLAMAFIVWALFRDDIRRLMRRLRRGKVLGTELELDQDLDRLGRGIAAATSHVPPVSPEPPAQPGKITPPNADPIASADQDATVRSILMEATTSPKAALLSISAEIERQLHEILTGLQLAEGRRHVPVLEAFRRMDKVGVVPKDVLSAVRVFWDIRNKIVHGGVADADETLRAIDYGISILRLLQVMPRHEFTVSQANVDVYADKEARKRRDDVRAIILQHSIADGLVTLRLILPTTLSEYRKGMVVAGAWDMERVFPESWYINPTTGKPEQAWQSAAEFVGLILKEHEDSQ